MKRERGRVQDAVLEWNISALDQVFDELWFEQGQHIVEVVSGIALRCMCLKALGQRDAERTLVLVLGPEARSLFGVAVPELCIA